MPVFARVLGIVFSCFFDLHYLVLLCRNGSTSHRHVRGTDGRTSNRYCRPRCLPCPPATGRRTLCPGTPSWGGALLAFLFSVFHHGVANWKPFLEFAHFSPCMQSVTEVNAEGKSEEAVLGQGRRSQTLQIFLYIKILLFIFFPKHNFEDFSPRSRKLAGVTLASARIGRSESNTLIFHSNPPLPRCILGRSWKQMVTGSNPARSLGNLYSAYPTPIKIPSCFQAHMNRSFRSPPLGLKCCGSIRIWYFSPAFFTRIFGVWISFEEKTWIQQTDGFDLQTTRRAVRPKNELAYSAAKKVAMTQWGINSIY